MDRATGTLARGRGVVLRVAAIAILSAPVRAQQPGQKTFGAPEQAADALFAAVQSDDSRLILALLGPAGSEVVASGDSEQDKSDRDWFVRKYQEMHRLAREPDGSTALYVGAENWPLPIPLAERDGAWYFDTGAGKQEILFRRIGRNELAAIGVCHALVDAQAAYYASPPDGGAVRHYAKRFISDSSRRDGLYWRGADAQTAGAIGPLLADAARGDRATPFHGYYYRLLTRQGRHAPGGEKSYFIGAELVRGFAFVAYPAEYGSSGVMTFIVDREGVVYEKDLGAHTSMLATALSAYDPDTTWQRAE